MSLTAALLPEFDHEMATTRRLLERTPEADAAWKPHPKATSLGQLAIHIAMLPGWLVMTINDTELDMSPPGGPAFSLPDFRSTAALLETFDTNVAAARAALVAGGAADPTTIWTLRNAGEPIFALPRAVVARTFIMNHFIHHRGQYAVYLRMRDVALPSIYGPTADTAGPPSVPSPPPMPAPPPRDSLKRHGDALIDGSGGR